jgi:acetylxylan esterase
MILSALVTFLFALCRLSAAEELVKRASLRQVSNFGANPSGAKMFIYVPDRVAAKPPVIVAIHHCQGTGNSYYQSTPYARLADQYGFIVIYPESPYSGTCWDVSSRATLTHEGGANSNAIANMVRYTISQHNADASRVYVTGSSSGAMMTNVMAATYPDMFVAGIVYSGVPAGCFMSASNAVAGWNSTCAQGNSRASQQQWAQVVRNMYPGFTGRYPKMQIYHGSADDILRAQNYEETIKQWTGVNGYSMTPTSSQPGTPIGQCKKDIFGDQLQGIYCTGVGHSVVVMGDEDMKFFGIPSGGATKPGTGGGSPTTTRPPTTTTAPPNNGGGGGNCAALYGQCGGQGYTGPKCCAQGTCKFTNDWYSQCQ